MDREMSKFEEEVRKLINSLSEENESDTPDYILAKYLNGCLAIFNNAVNERRDWHSTENTKDWYKNDRKK